MALFLSRVVTKERLRNWYGAVKWPTPTLFLFLGGKIEAWLNLRLTTYDDRWAFTFFVAILGFCCTSLSLKVCAFPFFSLLVSFFCHAAPWYISPLEVFLPRPHVYIAARVFLFMPLHIFRARFFFLPPLFFWRRFCWKFSNLLWVFSSALYSMENELFAYFCEVGGSRKLVWCWEFPRKSQHFSYTIYSSTLAANPFVFLLKSRSFLQFSSFFFFERVFWRKLPALRKNVERVLWRNLKKALPF